MRIEDISSPDIVGEFYMKLYNKYRDELFILYHYEESLETGDSLLIWDEDAERGLIALITSHELLGSGGVLDELARQVLAEHTFALEEHMDDQLKKLMSDMFNLKIAKAKIRMEIKDGNIGFWSGWIPTRSASVKRLSFSELLKYLGIDEKIISISVGETSEGEMVLDAEALQGINIIVGEKGSGKSYLAKVLLSQLIKKRAKAIVIDLNNEYSGLRYYQDGDKSDINTMIHVYSLSPSGNRMRFTLDYIGLNVMQIILNKILDLPEHSTRVFGKLWSQVRKRYNHVSLSELSKALEIERNENVRNAIQSRLEILLSMGIVTDDPEDSLNIESALNRLDEGGCMVINLKGVDYQTTLVIIQILISKLSDILEKSSETIFLFIEEAQLYMRETEWINLVTRVRHLGLFQTYITNTPKSLIPHVIDQADNLFLFRLSDEEDIRYLTPIARMDSATLNELAKSLPYRKFLVFGKISRHYPILTNNLKINYITAGEAKKLW